MASATFPNARPVFLDCDPGLDDAIALMVLASHPEQVYLKGITTVAGNQSGEKTFQNARRLAAWLNLSAPVAMGAKRPFSENRAPVCAADVHGEDGLAGMRAGSRLADASPLTAEQLLWQGISSAQQPQTLICTGPLTNLAQLLSHHPEAAKQVDHLTIMGGSLSGGNVTPFAEFNFYADPEAADFVLTSGIPITLLGLDVTHKAYLTDEEITHFASLHTRHGDMVGDLMAFYAAHYHTTGLPGTPVHDASAVLCELFPQLFPESRMLSLRVRTDGEHAGECVTNPAAPPNVRFVTDVDRAAFVSALEDCCLK